jgi:hypothetical protein
VSDYPHIELSRRPGRFFSSWIAVVRYGPEQYEWCCLSIRGTKAGAISASRSKWKEKQKPYVEPEIVDLVPL